MPRRRSIANWKVEADGVEYAVRVTLKGTSFKAVCAELHIAVEGTDLEVLREAITQQVQQVARIQWGRYIHVCCSGYQSADWGAGFTLQVHYEFIEIADRRNELNPLAYLEMGGDPEEAVSRFLWRKLTPEGTIRIEPYVEHPTREGLPHVGPASSYQSYSLIVDTPEAREGLARIVAAMHALDQRLKDFLSPRKAQAFLAGLASGKPLLG